MHYRLVKKLILVVLAFILVLALSACGSKDDPVATTTEQKENAITFESVNVGSRIKKDYIEMSFEQAGTADSILPSNPTELFYSTFPDEENKTYFYVTGTVKNTGANAFMINNIFCNLEFDGKYNYSASIKVDTGNDFYTSNIDPLATEKYYIFASVPDEMISSYSTCKVQFAFHNNMKSDYRADFDRFENRYEITLTKNSVPHTNPGKTPEPKNLWD